jgi:hypothetical protein
VVMDLSRRVLLRIKDCGCVDISPNPTGYSGTIQRDEMVGLETQSGLI